MGKLINIADLRALQAARRVRESLLSNFEELCDRCGTCFDDDELGAPLASFNFAAVHDPDGNCENCVSADVCDDVWRLICKEAHDT